MELRPDVVALRSVNEVLAGEIRASMARQNMRQARLAELLSRNQQWLSRRLTGEVSLTIDELIEICGQVGVKVLDLLAVIEPMLEPAS